MRHCLYNVTYTMRHCLYNVTYTMRHCIYKTVWLFENDGAVKTKISLQRNTCIESKLNYFFLINLSGWYNVDKNFQVKHCLSFVLKLLAVCNSSDFFTFDICAFYLNS